jgi:hypothetical protein
MGKAKERYKEERSDFETLNYIGLSSITPLHKTPQYRLHTVSSTQIHKEGNKKKESSTVYHNSEVMITEIEDSPAPSRAAYTAASCVVLSVTEELVRNLFVL